MRKHLAMLTLTAASVVVAAPANAATMIFTDREAFEQAAGNTTSEDFNGFATEEEFRTQTVNANGFSLSTTGTQSAFLAPRNFIDIPPALFTTLNGDGTTFADVFINDSFFGDLTVQFTFDAPISAFGADFTDLQTESAGTTILSFNGETVTPGVADAGVTRFFGFTSMQPFTTLTFSRVGPGFGGGSEGFGVDNVAFGDGVTAAVPEPATWLMMILGFGFVGGSMRLQRKGQFKSSLA